MRDLKFRLINNGKVVGYELHELDTPCGTINIYHNNMNIEAVKDAYIFHDSKDQFTGLKDKNGVEIYEGDIVRSANYKIPCVVKYNVTVPNNVWSYRAGFTLKEVNTPCMNTSNFNECEVIGNIHQNPELLTK